MSVVTSYKGSTWGECGVRQDRKNKKVSVLDTIAYLSLKSKQYASNVFNKMDVDIKRKCQWLQMHGQGQKPTPFAENTLMIEIIDYLLGKCMVFPRISNLERVRWLLSHDEEVEDGEVVEDPKEVIVQEVETEEYVQEPEDVVVATMELEEYPPVKRRRLELDLKLAELAYDQARLMFEKDRWQFDQTRLGTYAELAAKMPNNAIWTQACSDRITKLLLQ
jgi:hypothetical protein